MASQTGGTLSTSATPTSESYTNPTIQSLWSDAESLLSSYYPSSTLTNIASLTWPGTVVLGSSTYTLSTEASTLSTTRVSPSSTPTPTKIDSTSTSAAANSEANDHSDKRLGLGLGVALGCVALGILIFLIWLLHRRKRLANNKSSGQFTSVSEAEIQSWRAPATYSNDFPEKYVNLQAPRPPVVPVGSHPAFSPDHIGRSKARLSQGEHDPFVAPYEGYAELAAQASRHQSRTSLVHELHGTSSIMQIQDDRRPETPITRAAMSAVGSSTHQKDPLIHSPPISPVSPVDEVRDRGFWRTPQPRSFPYSHGDFHNDEPELRHHPRYSNPFSSEEDYELEAPPSIPTRSPRRRSSPVIHYPSGDELSTFNFGTGFRSLADEDHGDGGDGWRAGR